MPRHKPSRSLTGNKSFRQQRDGSHVQMQDVWKDPSTDFTLTEKLGQGAYGCVFKAEHKKSKALFAVKVVNVDADLRELRKEVDLMRSLQHDKIVRYFGSYFGVNADLWIVMEYMGAGSTSDMMKICEKTFSIDQITVIVRDTLEALEFMHTQSKKQMIHRDIKAGNILLNEHGISKLADFGVSGQITETMSKMNTVIGSPYWMAPEVIQETGYTTKVDIWSLGITVIELTQGQPPHYDIHPMRAIFVIPSRPSPTFADPSLYPESLISFVAACLQKTPADRPTASQLLQHPFIVNSKASRECILPMIAEQNVIIEQKGREIALGLDDAESESGSSSKSDDDSDSDSSFGHGTCIRLPQKTSEDLNATKEKMENLFSHTDQTESEDDSIYDTVRITPSVSSKSIAETQYDFEASAAPPTVPDNLDSQREELIIENDRLRQERDFLSQELIQANLTSEETQSELSRIVFEMTKKITEQEKELNSMREQLKESFEMTKKMIEQEQETNLMHEQLKESRIEISNLKALVSQSSISQSNSSESNNSASVLSISKECDTSTIPLSSRNDFRLAFKKYDLLNTYEQRLIMPGHDLYLSHRGSLRGEYVQVLSFSSIPLWLRLLAKSDNRKYDPLSPFSTSRYDPLGPVCSSWWAEPSVGCSILLAFRAHHFLEAQVLVRTALDRISTSLSKSHHEWKGPKVGIVACDDCPSFFLMGIRTTEDGQSTTCDVFGGEDGPGGVREMHTTLKRLLESYQTRWLSLQKEVIYLR